MLQIVYGVDKVRGSVWCQHELTSAQKEDIARAIDEEVYERCHGCKVDGHFINECPMTTLEYTQTE
jgi:hypothetical protein